MPGDQLFLKTVPPLCLEYGFTREVIDRRLQLLELGRADEPALTLLHEQIIKPHSHAIIDRFYTFLMQAPEYSIILSNNLKTPDQLKPFMHAYLLRFGQDVSDPGYFECRLRGGIAHERIGLSLSMYQVAFRYLMQCVAEYFPDMDVSMISTLHTVLRKVAALDMSITVEAYFQASVKELEHEGEELRRRVDTDSLTNVASHDFVMRFLRQAMDSARANAEPLCIVMADLDHFKKVNDDHGHLVGDRVLRDVAARMKSAVRDFDLVGRYGGEEFLVVLRRSTLEKATEVAERMRQRLSESPIHVDNLQIPMTISQGISLHQPGDKPEMLIDRADRALYAAKEAGRNCVRVGV